MEPLRQTFDDMLYSPYWTPSTYTRRLVSYTSSPTLYGTPAVRLMWPPSILNRASGWPQSPPKTLIAFSHRLNATSSPPPRFQI